MATKAERIHALIHTAAAAAAAVGGGLAQAPGSDAALITPIQVAMIVAIGAEHGMPVSKTAAAELILPFPPSSEEASASSCSANAGTGQRPQPLNAATAAALTEAIGWAVDTYFIYAPCRTKVRTSGWDRFPESSA